MYWYKTKLTGKSFFLGFVLAVALPACKPDIKETGGAMPFFDIKGYFNKEILRLTKTNPLIDKTVSHNKDSENKKVNIKNWKQELDLFTSSDINRPAWKNSYTVIDNDSALIYRAKYPELQMREMVIKRIDGKVKWILVFNKTKNILYQTTEKLSYFPDSAYLIEKDQRIRLMKNNHYSIEGRFSR